MLTKYIFFVLIVVLLVYAAKSSVREHFEDEIINDDVDMAKPDNISVDASPDYVSADSKIVELIENKEIIGSFKLDNVDGTALIDLSGDLSGLSVEFNMKSASGIIVKARDKIVATIKKSITINTEYKYRLIFFPIEQYMVLLLNNNLVYNGYSELVGIPPDKKIAVKVKGSNGTVSKLKVIKSQYSFFNSENELFKLKDGSYYLNSGSDNILEALKNDQIGDKKSIIWNIEKRGKYYSIRNIVNNLSLSVNNRSTVLTGQSDNSTKLIMITAESYPSGKKSYVILSMTGEVITILDTKQSSAWSETIKMETVENVGNWLNFGSTINLANSDKQFFSGNLNAPYDFKGASGLPSVYCDNEADKQLIQWTLDSITEKKRGYYIKENDYTFLKNNGKYLQIIRGNSTPSGVGMEISLGSDKNDNSKWNILHDSNANRLFRTNDKVYLYHPKTETYLYNTGNLFQVAGKSKIEIISIDKKENRSIWTIGKVISLEAVKDIPKQTIDYDQYNINDAYFKNKEEQWKNKILRTQNKISKSINRYNSLTSQEKQLNDSIEKSKQEIREIRKTKCPPRRLCLDGANYPCKQPKPKEKTKKEQEQLYDLVYVKEKKELYDPKWINSKSVTKCKTVNDFDLENSSYVKSGKYVLKKGAKTKITDFKISEFPEAKDYISIDDIPNESQIRDFKISELPGFDKLKLK